MQNDNSIPRNSNMSMAYANKNVNTTENTQTKLEEINKRISEAKNSSSTVTINQNQDVWWSNRNAMTISSIVLIYSFLIVLIAGYLIKIGRTSESVLKILGVILIITSSVFLVVAGYSDQQISPVIGLLGTLAGYLLGKDTKEQTSSSLSPTKGSENDASKA